MNIDVKTLATSPMCPGGASHSPVMSHGTSAYSLTGQSPVAFDVTSQPPS